MSSTEAPSSPRPDPLKDIPSQVYHFLFKIALENHEPDTIQDWYSAMLSHVRQAHTHGIREQYLRRPSMQSTPPPRPARAPVKTWTLAVRDPNDPAEPGEDNSVSDLVRAARELPGRITNTTPNSAQDEASWPLTSATSSPMPCSTPAFQAIPDFTTSTHIDSVPSQDHPSLMPPSATSSRFISPRTPATSSEIWFSSAFPDTSTYSTTAAPTFDNVFLQQDPSNAFASFTNSFYTTTPDTTTFDFLSNQTNLTNNITNKDFMMPLPPSTSQPHLTAITTTSPTQAITQTSPMSSTSSMLGFREIRPATDRTLQNFSLPSASSTGSPRKRQRESMDGETMVWEAMQRSRKHQSM